jgi:hypothetical protein
VACHAPFSRRPRAQSTKRGRLKRPGQGKGGGGSARDCCDVDDIYDDDYNDNDDDDDDHDNDYDYDYD